MKWIFSCVLPLILSLTTQPALALERPAAFKIKAIYMSKPENFHFRVISNNPEAWHCSGGPKNPAWSYINESDPGSKGMMAALLTAYASKKTVRLYTQGIDTTVGRMCKIIEFQIDD